MDGEKILWMMKAAPSELDSNMPGPSLGSNLGCSSHQAKADGNQSWKHNVAEVWRYLRFSEYETLHSVDVTPALRLTSTSIFDSAQ
jgi:hypothetical protein